MRSNSDSAFRHAAAVLFGVGKRLPQSRMGVLQTGQRGCFQSDLAVRRHGKQTHVLFEAIGYLLISTDNSLRVELTKNLCRHAKLVRHPTVLCSMCNLQFEVSPQLPYFTVEVLRFAHVYIALVPKSLPSGYVAHFMTSNVP
jgi:hypothetical protein